MSSTLETVVATTATQTPSPPLPRQAGAPWPIGEAATFLSVSERHVHRLLDANKVRSVRLGRRRLIPDAEVQRLARECC
jgi:excisionase family DNA binding protein